MPKKIIKEVGEGSSQSFPTKRNTDDTFFNIGAKDEYDYHFTTNEGYTYSVVLERLVGWGATEEWEFEEDIEEFKKMYGNAFEKLKSYGITLPDMSNMWGVTFSIKEHKHPETGVLDQSPPLKKFYYTPSKGEFYKVMATLSKIVKDHMKLVEGKILVFLPQNPKRGKVFTHFILKQKPDIKYFEERSSFYFIF
jgi:hypothetical protein